MKSKRRKKKINILEQELEKKQEELEKTLQKLQEAEKYRDVQIAKKAVDDILENITMLDNISSEEELNQIMPQLLSSMGRYSRADRSYIFAWTSEEQMAMYMTHEWCNEGVVPTIKSMQNLQISDMPNWIVKLRAGETIISMDWEADKKYMPEEYVTFEGQDIQSLIVIPIFSNKKLSGYIGFDNPEQRKTALSVSLLKAVGGHIGGLRENLKMVSKLEEALQTATLNSEIVNAISKIYWLIYRMDLVTGIYEEISAGKEIHRLTGKRGRIEEVFRQICETIVAREYQEEMKVFLDISTLGERLRETESVAIEYCSVNGPWHLGRFIAKKRDKNGKVINVLYVVREIDKQKQLEIEYKRKLLETAEEARKANIAKTDFLRRMSHDIRTPINGILGMIRIAEHYSDDNERQKECRAKVKEAAGYLLDLVNSVLDMNKLESGAVILENEPFDLIKLLSESNNIIKMSAEVEGLSVSFNHESVKHRYLIGSAIHLKQILQNIAGNAVKYNRENGRIDLSCEELEYDGKKAIYEFRCKDTGYGMSEEFINHAFEPFAQENQGARTSYMGTGLGLAIAKQLTEMMNGRIEVESKLNVGTIFTMRIPFEIDAAHEETVKHEMEDSKDCLKGKRVLIAEDNELNMEIAEFLLENAGMMVTKAWNGEEAVNEFTMSEEGHFDYILMDVMMPVMDGLAASKKIRNLSRKDAQSIPIFAMTANAFSEDREGSKNAGMNEHLSKPLDEKLMMQMFKKYC